MARKFEDFVKEAKKTERGNHDPYVFVIGDRKISIDSPDAQVYLSIRQLQDNDVLGQLQILFGSNTSDFRYFLDNLKGAPVSSVPLLIEDMYSFWNTEVPSPGNSSK